MNNLSFLKFNQLCKLNAEKKYVRECIDCIENEDCLYHCGTVMPAGHVLSTYSLRLEIAKGRDVADQDYINDFVQIVESIKNVKAENIGIADLYRSNFFYLVFYEPDDLVIIGILKFMN